LRKHRSHEGLGHAGLGHEGSGLGYKGITYGQGGLARRLRSQFRALQEDLRDSKCLPGCTKFGTCNEELGRCDCPRHRSGPDCSTEASNITAVCRQYGFRMEHCFDEKSSGCINACNRRGKCMSGFCHCKSGYYGADCSLSLGPDGLPVLLEGQGYTPRKRAPKIYVYELPPSLNNVWFNIARLDRPLFYLFWQRLLSAGVRVANGDEADYYFIPIKHRMGGHDNKVGMDSIAYIRQHWPWWDRYGGGRHILIQTGDMGRGEATAELRALAENVTWLTHWGLHRDHKYARWGKSHRPGQDVVIPIFLQPALVASYGMHVSPLHRNAPPHGPRNRTTLFFAGRICGDRKEPLKGAWPNCDLKEGGRNGYSAGTRQKIHFHHHNRTGFLVVTSTRHYGKEMGGSRFCLAPTGGGHGKRNVLVSVMGCVPVTVTDHVYQPFEPEVHWSDFAVQLAEKDIPHMHHMLANISSGQLQEYQKKLWCGAQHIFWSSIYGGILGDDGRYDAFETTLEILRMKLKYPGLAPEQYADKDAEFRSFMECRALPLQEPPDLCSYSRFKTSAFPCDQCIKGTPGRFGIPGGAVCCEQQELAKCARLWA